MFFIVFGDCQIKNRCVDGRLFVKKEILVQHDHFGEIGCLYNCTRTCSIIGAKYNILARLTKQRLRVLISDYPKLLKVFLKNVFKINDDYK